MVQRTELVTNENFINRLLHESGAHMKKYFISLTIAFLCPLTVLAALKGPVKTIFVSKFQCSPSNKIVLNFSEKYILKNPSVPQLPSTDRVVVNKYFRVVDGSARGATGTLEELLKLPGVGTNTRVEQIARFAQINQSDESTLRVFRSFYDPKICKPDEKETCLWNDMLNVYQDITISQDGSLAATMSNGDGYTPDITVYDLATNQKIVLFTTGYQKPYETSGKPVGQVNFISDSKGAPRFLAFRDGGYGRARISLTFFDLVTKKQLTIPREEIENLIGIEPNPTYPQYVEMKTYYSVNVEKLLADVENGSWPAETVSVDLKSPACPPFLQID